MSEEHGDRYELDELVTLYRFEPTIRDIICEGAQDVGFYSWYLTQHDLDAVVTAVDARVSIPSELVRSYGLDIGAKGRAVALAAAVEQILGAFSRSLTVVVDADTSAVVGPIPLMHTLLLITDRPALENYALAERPLEKFLRVVVYAPSAITAKSLIAQICYVLTQVQAVRTVLHYYQVAVASRYVNLISFEGGRYEIDMRELLRRSLGSRFADIGIPLDELALDATCVLEWLTEFEQFGRGHDIASVLRLALASSCSSVRLLDIEAGMRACIECSDIDSAPFFTRLRARLAT